jgi:SAM-dependent methyltransferase
LPEAPEPWNHNNHYHRVVFEAIPAGCDRALDVGCGTGRLTRELRRVIPHVTGIDRDEQSIAVARSHAGAAGIEYRCGDFLDLPLRPGGFGLITAVASLHHMDTATALKRMREQLRPGGVLVVIGLARDGWSPADLAIEVPAAVSHRIQRRRHRPGRPPGDGAAAGTAPYQPPIVWPPAETYQQVRRLAGTLLPGVRYRRHLLWRYSICWVKPGRG